MSYRVYRFDISMTKDQERLELEPQTVVCILRNVLHQIEASEDVEALWLAWQAPRSFSSNTFARVGGWS